MKLKAIFPIIGLFLIAMLYTACEKSLRCIDGKGKLVNEDRGSTPFSRVLLEGSMNLVVIQDSITNVTVEAESNLMPYISTRVINNLLTVDLNGTKCLDNNYPVRIVVRTPVLNAAGIEGSGDILINDFYNGSMNMEISGSGNIHAGLYVNTVKAGISGSGNITISGTADAGEYSISGSGSVQAYDMALKKCYANISGSGSMFVNARDLLDVVISGSGSVFYKGNPQVITNISGSGSVIHR
ncbi:MAG: DUF2807 domain-containing protein [Bacteroidales bacterium]|nr:DUF2807 domain-containing protein [Bacteroidales bacterium]MCF8386509.1 DUF2807 domain-containing protein [Bacteroidales bacterium]MCF8397087.1 DUF2807 domain-containing protein [Bacteroidales bacterium]